MISALPNRSRARSLKRTPGQATTPTLATVKTAIRRDKKMSKEELIQFEGLVIEILPDARYRVQLDAGYEVVAYTAGKMKKSRIKTLVGDRVTIEMSPYDLQKGRLIFRHKDERLETDRRPPLRNQFRRR
jgi:translation initiation factor IF-1